MDSQPETKKTKRSSKSSKESGQSYEPTHEQKSKRGHMALRNNLWDLRLELWPILKPLEMWVIDLIIDRTIKWRQKEAKISVKELMERTRHDHTKIYRVLKSLETQKIIVRKKHNHDLFISLNEEYFGGLLIKRHEDALLARRSKIKIVVDNSKKVCQNSTGFVPKQHNISANGAQDLCQNSTKNMSQDIDITEETIPLNTLLKDTSINTLLKESEKPAESCTLSGKGKKDWIRGQSPEETERKRLEALAFLANLQEEEREQKCQREAIS